jgi:hypothetical protein
MMRGSAILMAWLASTVSASAFDLSGDWQFERPARNGLHVGRIVIDKDGQASMVGRGPVQGYAQCGRVEMAGKQVDIVFTSVKSLHGYAPDHFHCDLHDEGLRCFNDDGMGKEPELFMIKRMGGIPTADRTLEEACPAKGKPTSRARPVVDFG